MFFTTDVDATLPTANLYDGAGDTSASKSGYHCLPVSWWRSVIPSHHPTTRDFKSHSQNLMNLIYFLKRLKCCLTVCFVGMWELGTKWGWHIHWFHCELCLNILLVCALLHYFCQEFLGIFCKCQFPWSIIYIYIVQIKVSSYFGYYSCYNTFEGTLMCILKHNETEN